MIRDDWLMLNETGGKDDQRVEEEMQQSSLFRTIQQEILQAHQDGTSPHLLSPNQILGREAFPTSLQDRFGENEIEGIRKDLDKEQARLKSFVEKGRLEDHFGGLVTSAERDVRKFADGQGEKMAQEVIAKESNGTHV